MENSYTIHDLVVLILSRIWLILIITFVAGFGAFFSAKFIMAPKYESYTSMYVRNAKSIGEQADDVDVNDLNASKSLVSTYIAVLKSNTVMMEISDRLCETYDESQLSAVFNMKDGRISTEDILSCFTMSAVDETEVMKITANTVDPELSAEMCRIMGELAPSFLIRVVGAGSVEIIDEAFPNYTPVSPNIPGITVAGAFAGFGISIFIILLIDFFDDTIKDTDTLTKKYNKAIIGEVQSMSSDKDKKGKKGKKDKSRHLLTENGIPFVITESYKTMRTNLTFSLGTSEKKVIAISSPNPGEGKSTTAANVAIAFAQTDNAVLLIDADMRKPVQHRTFKVKNNEGLSTLIIGKSTIEDSIKKNVISGLDLLTTGPIPPNPSELLASEQFADIINELSKHYDYVIIDTPPVNVVSDAMVMKDTIDGIMLVCKYGSTTYDDVTNCMKSIELANANLFGFVLNNIVYSHGANYNYKYKYKYNYYSYGGKSSSGKSSNKQ